MSGVERDSRQFVFTRAHGNLHVGREVGDFFWFDMFHDFLRLFRAKQNVPLTYLKGKRDAVFCI